MRRRVSRRYSGDMKRLQAKKAKAVEAVAREFRSAARVPIPPSGLSPRRAGGSGIRSPESPAPNPEGSP